MNNLEYWIEAAKHTEPYQERDDRLESLLDGITNQLDILKNPIENEELNAALRTLLTSFTAFISPSQQGINTSIDTFINRYNQGVFVETIDYENLVPTILMAFYNFKYHNVRKNYKLINQFIKKYGWII